MKKLPIQKVGRSFFVKSLALFLIWPLLLGCAGTAGEMQESTGRIYDNDGVYSAEDAKIHVLYLTVSEGGSIPFREVTGSDRVAEKKPSYGMTLLDETAKEKGEAPLSGQLQIKGNASYIGEYRSFKLSLTGEGRYRGQRVFLLYKCPEDPVKITMKLGMDLFSLYDDVVSIQTEFVRLYLKDNPEGEYQDYGLYTMAENPGSRFLRNHGLDRNGMLVEVKDFDFSYDRYQGASETERREMLEIKNGQEPEKLEMLLEALAEAKTPEAFERFFTRFFNEENYLTFLAGSLLMGNQRIALRDFLLYSPTDEDRWYFFPMPTDRLFLEETEARRSTPPDSFFGIGLLMGSELHGRYFASEKNRAKLLEKSEHLMAVLDRERLGRILEQDKSVLADFLQRGPDRKTLKFSPEDTEERINGVYQTMEKNLRLMRDNLSLPLPFHLAEPVRIEKGYRLSWHPAYSTEDVTYHVEIAREMNRETLLFRGATAETQIEIEEVLTGDLYLFVTAENRQGTQPANCFTRDGDTVQWGTARFVFTELEGEE